ncbi:GRB2-associated and regulator of MAPK protein [Biomphalaria pfeifferi]|uniref:GRB2-associated and regulator of MAPK protein n=1 Tax=Biomphalaria pfeifferi TaxID=112525 RepID=A0AAD8CAX0_BIOPF|nr:GRB2-associated and regulator of MAPK protein [Biomphalaria pfeifferi]
MLKWTKQGQFKGNQGSRSDNGEYDSVFKTSTIKDTKEGARHCLLSSDVIDSIQRWNGEFQSQACTGECSKILEDHQHLRRQARNKELWTLSDYSSVQCGLTSCFLSSRNSSPAPKTLSKASEIPTSIDHSTHINTPLSNKTYKTPFSERITDNRRRVIIATASESDIIVQRPRSLSVPKTMASALPDITGSTILGPEVAWDEDNLSLSQLVDKDCFPCICCYEENVQEVDGHCDKLAPGLKIYSRQPVLLHTSVSQKQARARTIFKDPSGTYYEVGQTMIIPGDYQGWFELVPSDFTRASCFLSIAEIAKVMPKKFFTRSNVKAIRMEGEGESQKFLERKIPAGSVLEVKVPTWSSTSGSQAADEQITLAKQVVLTFENRNVTSLIEHSRCRGRFLAQSFC